MKWAYDAACRLPESNPVWWDEEEGACTDLAIQICSTCPVQPECLDEALTTQETNGIWGGLTSKQRQRIGTTRWEKGRR